LSLFHPLEGVRDHRYQKGSSDGTAIAAAAYHGDGAVARNLIDSVLDQPGVDVMGSIDVPAVPFALGARIDDEGSNGARDATVQFLDGDRFEGREGVALVLPIGDTVDQEALDIIEPDADQVSGDLLHLRGVIDDQQERSVVGEDPPRPVGKGRGERDVDGAGDVSASERFLRAGVDDQAFLADSL